MGVINPFITIGSGPTEWYATLIDEKKTPLLKASTESSPHDEEVMEVRQSLFFFFSAAETEIFGEVVLFFFGRGGWGGGGKTIVPGGRVCEFPPGQNDKFWAEFFC